MQPCHFFLNSINKSAFKAIPASCPFGSSLPQLTRRELSTTTTASCPRQQFTLMNEIKMRAKVRHRKLPVQVPVTMADAPKFREPDYRRPLETKDDHLPRPPGFPLCEWARDLALLIVGDLN